MQAGDLLSLKHSCIKYPSGRLQSTAMLKAGSLDNPSTTSLTLSQILVWPIKKTIL